MSQYFELLSVFGCSVIQLPSSSQEDIRIAKDIVNGKYTYCEKCDDYFITKSFFTETETKEAEIYTYVDPINSGGNDYADGYIDITYRVCPKGHKHEIHRTHRNK